MSIASYRGLKPASTAATSVGRGNRSQGTRPELILRRSLWRAGLRYRLGTSSVLGRPDIALRGLRVAIFCDGDFWHGKDWSARRAKLAKGHNSKYWVEKIERNRARDRRITRQLRAHGWLVIRVWESDVRTDVNAVTHAIITAVTRRKRHA